MMRKVLLLLICLIAVPTAAAQTREVSFGEELGRGELIREVLANNPALDAATARVGAAAHDADETAFYDDPVLSAGVAPLSLGDGSIGARVQVGQRIPWPGRLALRTDRALTSRDIAEWSETDVAIDLALQASVLFDRWYLVHRALELNAHHYAQAEQLKASAEAQYVSGGASQQDPLQAEVRMSRLERERIALQTDSRRIRARINALLHREPSSELSPPPGELPLPAMPHAKRSETERNPDRGRALALVEARSFDVKLAELESRPDIDAMAEYSSMMPDHDNRFVVGIRVMLPVRKGRLAAVRAAEKARLDAAKADFESVTDEINFEIENARLELEAALETIEIFESQLVPASNDQVDAARIAFTTGRSPFFILIDAEKNLEEAVLGYHEAVVEAWNAAARLEALHGDVPFVGGVK